MNIGVDFDGVIADAIKLKQKFFKQELGIDVNPEECSWEKLEGRVSEEDYVRIVEGVIYGTELCLQMEDVPDAREVIRKLRKDGHKVYIITSRYDLQAEYAEKLMEMRGVEYDGMINTGKKPKRGVCEENNIGILVEDSPRKLVQARRPGMRAILLTRPYNADVELEEGIERAENWEEVYEILNSGSD